MKTIIVDDEYWALERVKQECAGDPAIEIAGTFMDSEEALEYAEKNKVEFALLDIQMAGMNGLDLARKLRELYPGVIIVFVTAHRQYLGDFIDMKADYFVLKPYTAADIRDVLERAKLLGGRLKKRVFIRTFGEFRVFVDGEPLLFSSKRAEELLALIVNKQGNYLSNKEAASRLWDPGEYDKQSASSYRKVLSRLEQFLEDKGIEDILLNSIHGRALNTKKVDCDLMDFLSGDPAALEAFHGRYMYQYSWGEEEVGPLVKRKTEEMGRIK